jgi:2-hydroxy-3-keto-5-methylthiopentenyl-1-phosphate phosphatase
MTLLLPPATFDGRKLAIFSDFDGTITERDVIVMIMERFAPPEWRDLVDRMVKQRTLRIRDGVGALFHLLPGSLRPEIETFVASEVKIRPGFDAFLAFCQEQSIDFNVVSGGVDFFLHPVLAPYVPRERIFCNAAQFTDARIELTFPHLNEHCAPCNNCAVCKIDILERYPTEDYFRIAIGDSISDLGMAGHADLLFARGKLVDEAEALGIVPIPFDTFDDILATLRRMLILEHSEEPLICRE